MLWYVRLHYVELGKDDRVADAKVFYFLLMDVCACPALSSLPLFLRPHVVAVVVARPVALSF